MNSLIKIHLATVAVIVAAILAGCGSGGGGKPVVNGGGDIVASTVVSGTASKGIIYPGKVNIYGVDASGSMSGAPIATAVTDNKGRYTVDIGNYSGPLVIEASGEYTDEATGTKVTIVPTAPLHAAVDAVDGSAKNNRVVAVTPLTELAYAMMAGSLTPAGITAVNQRVGEIFKIADIIGTEPVKYDPVAMDALGVSTSQQSYTIALATLSQMAKNLGTGSPASFSQIKSLMDSFKTDTAASPTAGLGKANSTGFASALASVSNRPEMSKYSRPMSSLSGVGSPILKLTLVTANVPAGVPLGSLMTTITLPAGVSIPAGANGQVADGLILPAGTAAGGTAIVAGNYKETASNLVVSLVSSAGFRNGDCAEITVNVPPGSALKASDFAVSINEAKDAGPTYGPVTGVTVSLK